MTETTTDAAEPWVAVGPPAGAGFFDEPVGFLDPGPLATWRREQAQLAAEERRKEEERIERADARRAVAEWNARQSAISRGLPWSPERPFEHEPSIYTKADAIFRLQDAQQRDADRRALREHGLEHLLGDLPIPPVASPGDAAPPTSRSRALAPTSGAARANPVAAKVRAAFDRWATRSSGHRSTGCGCAACDPDVLHRADAEAGLPPREIVRTYFEGAHIR